MNIPHRRLDGTREKRDRDYHVPAGRAIRLGNTLEAKSAGHRRLMPTQTATKYSSAG